MKNKYLSKDELQTLETRVHQFEKDTGVELLMVVAESSDPYPAASLRLSLVLTFLFMTLVAQYSHYSNAVTVYSFAGFFLLFLPLGRMRFFKRLALSYVETDREVKEKALEIFYNKAISRASETPTILLYCSLLERKFEVLAHEKIHQLVPADTWDKVTREAIPHFSKENIFDAFLQATTSVEKVVQQFGPEFKNNKLKERHADALIWIEEK